MSRSDLTETGRDRAALARDAGFSRISFVSVLAGVLVAYGAFAVLLAAAAAVANAIGVDNSLTINEWAQIGVGSAVAIVAVVLLAAGFGGYVAGRMARRAGLLNGLAVFVLAAGIIAVLAAIAATQADSSDIVANLRSLGIPTSGSEWGAVSTVAGLGSLVAMLFGAAFGGILGERWHTKLTRRAASVDTAVTERDRDREGALDDQDLDGVPDDREMAGRDRTGAERPRTGADSARPRTGAESARPRTGADSARPVPVRFGRVRASSVLAGEGQRAAGPSGGAGPEDQPDQHTDSGGEGRHLAGRAGTNDPRDTAVLETIDPESATRPEQQARRRR